jgi:ferredoxin--NADP+ reductase
MYRILERRDLTDITKLFVVDAPFVARRAEPGQFVIVRVREQGERIPLTIADFDRKKGSITIVVQEVGLSSKLINQLGTGDTFLDFVGPLGQPAPIRQDGTVVFVGGGFGVAPIYPIAKLMRAQGKVRIISILGARSRNLLIMEKEMAAVAHEQLVATDDGSYGHKGFVTDVLKGLIDKGTKIDEVIAIGPMMMMRAVSNLTKGYGLRTLVSADPIMVDGTGMCGACRLTVGGKVKFACVDGPIMDGHQVDFEEAVRRGKMYAPEQKTALEHHEKHQCRCGGGK